MDRFPTRRSYPCRYLTGRSDQAAAVASHSCPQYHKMEMNDLIRLDCSVSRASAPACSPIRGVVLAMGNHTHGRVEDLHSRLVRGDHTCAPGIYSLTAAIAALQLCTFVGGPTRKSFAMTLRFLS